MQFHVFEVQRMKGNILHLHTPSCKRNEAMKKKGASLWKIDAPFIDDAKQNFVITSKSLPVLVHMQCCGPFRKPVNSNPPCAHCQSLNTTLRGKLSPGHYEYACQSCKKTFVIKREKRIMKIKITKSGKATKAKMTRDQRKAVRLQARIDRQAARAKRKEDRQGARILRMGARMQKMAERFAKMPQIASNAVDELMKAIEECTGAGPMIVASKKKVAKKVAKKTTPKKATKKTPLKKVAYAPATSVAPAPKAAAKKTARRKK